MKFLFENPQPILVQSPRRIRDDNRDIIYQISTGTHISIPAQYPSRSIPTFPHVYMPFANLFVGKIFRFSLWFILKDMFGTRYYMLLEPLRVLDYYNTIFGSYNILN